VVVVALCSIAQADAFECKATETQAECHTRLKCKANEEVEDCQKRLRAAAANGGNNGGNNGGGNDRANDRGGDDRGGDDRGGNDRGGSDRGGSDRGGSDRYDDDRGRRGGGGGRGRGRRGGGGGHGFEANKTFGLGLELGEPTGLNGKYFFGPSTALDFGIGAIYQHYYYGDGLHLYGDILFHPVSLASTPALEIPFYVGGGLRYWDFRYCVGNVCDYGGSAVGIRVPLGISFDFNNVPLDIFIQLVPTIDFLAGDYYDRYRDRNHFGVDFSLGIRFWLK
jgi:hypothetical protein